MGRVIFAVILGALALGCTNGAPTYYQDSVTPVCVDQPDPWPCLRIGARMSGLMVQLTTAADSQDATKTEALADQLSVIGIDYDVCLQTYSSGWNWSSP